jgi:hypothetical protein
MHKLSGLLKVFFSEANLYGRKKEGREKKNKADIKT